MIKLGFVGAGRIAIAHLNALKDLDNIFEPVAVADPVLENAIQIKKEFGIEKLYTDYNEMINNEKLDLVVVLAPNGLHYKISRDIMEKGISVLVEKPLVLSYSEARNLVEIEKSKRVFLGVVLQKRLLPVFRKLKFAIQEGKLGKIFLVHFALKWSRSKEYFSNSWRGTREMDGGLVFNQAIHDIDLVDYLLSFSEVFAYGGTFIHDIETEDNVVGVFKTESGAIGNFEFSISIKDKNIGEVMEIFGEKDKFIYGTGQYGNLTTFPNFLELNDDDLGLLKEPTLSGKAHKLVYENIANMFNSGDFNNSVIDAKNVLHSLLVAEGILASVKSGRKIDLKGGEN